MLSLEAQPALPLVDLEGCAAELFPAQVAQQARGGSGWCLAGARGRQHVSDRTYETMKQPRKRGITELCSRESCSVVKPIFNLILSYLPS